MMHAFRNKFEINLRIVALWRACKQVPVEIITYWKVKHALQNTERPELRIMNTFIPAALWLTICSRWSDGEIVIRKITAQRRLLFFIFSFPKAVGA